MKIELTLPALERLIGGDAEIEISARKQIVQEFARRHLKEVAESETYLQAISEVKNIVNDLVKNHLGIENIATSHLWPTISQRLKMMVDKTVNDSIDKAIEAVIQDKIDRYKHYWQSEVIKAVNKEMERQIEQEIREGIRRKLEKVME